MFVLKGKPLNVWDLKRDIVYKNDEMYNLMRALDIEDNIEGLRYDKVILATDADVDGLHIRNLMITYFFRFFDQLVHDGHLYVLETPLFRVRNKEKTIYCYSEAERDDAHRRSSAASRRSRASKVWAKFHPASSSNSSAKKCALSKVEYAPKTEACEHPHLLHGQEHARAQRLHHGESGGAGGGSEVGSFVEKNVTLSGGDGVRGAGMTRGAAALWTVKFHLDPFVARRVINRGAA